MRAWKKRALELADWMRDADPAGAGLSLADLRKASGLSRSTLRWSLIWLEDVRAVSRRLDERKRPRWTAPPAEEPDEPQELPASPRLTELGLDYDYATELLSSLIG